MLEFNDEWGKRHALLRYQANLIDHIMFMEMNLGFDYATITDRLLSRGWIIIEFREATPEDWIKYWPEIERKMRSDVRMLWSANFDLNADLPAMRR